MSADAAIAIAGMAVLTYAIRLSGFLLAAWIPQHGFAAAWLRHLPGAVLAAIVAPVIATGGAAEATAAAITLAIAALTRSLFLAMAAGVASVWLARTLVLPIL